MRINIQKTKVLICRCYDISPCDLQLKCRKKQFFRPRQIISYILKLYSKLTLDEIASEVGNLNHGTIIYGVKKIQNEISIYPVFSEFIVNIISLIKKHNYNAHIQPPTEPYYRIINFSKTESQNKAKKEIPPTHSFKIYVPPPEILKELSRHMRPIEQHQFRDTNFKVSWLEPDGRKFICQYF